MAVLINVGLLLAQRVWISARTSTSPAESHRQALMLHPESKTMMKGRTIRNANEVAPCAKASVGIGLHYKQRRLNFADLIGILCWTCDREARYQHLIAINFVKPD
jgi:hypothetical protein